MEPEKPPELPKKLFEQKVLVDVQLDVGRQLLQHLVVFRGLQEIKSVTVANEVYLILYL